MDRRFFDKIIDAAFGEFEHEPEKYIERQMRVAERDLFYKQNDFLNDLLLRLSERLNSINKEFDKKQASLAYSLTDEMINRYNWSGYYANVIDKNEGISMDEYLTREYSKRKAELNAAKKTLIKEHNKITNQYSMLEKKIKQLKRSANVMEKDLSKLDELFVIKLSQAKAGEKSPLERFKKDLETSLPGYNKKCITALAGAIYNGEILHHNVKPRTFRSWLEIFCEIIGKKEVPTIKLSTVSKEIEKMKETYYYLFE